jgi:hypothetical protein
MFIPKPRKVVKAYQTLAMSAEWWSLVMGGLLWELIKQ